MAITESGRDARSAMELDVLSDKLALIAKDWEYREELSRKMLSSLLE